MKRLLIAAFSIFAFFELVVGLSYAVYQPQSLGSVTFGFSTMTITGINKTTAPLVGYPVWCYDCVANGGAGTNCVSTGTTNVFQWILSTGTRCK